MCLLSLSAFPTLFFEPFGWFNFPFTHFPLSWPRNCQTCVVILRKITLGARGFSCAVSGFGKVLKSYPRVFPRGFAARVIGLRPNTCRPAVDETKLPDAREKKPLVPRVEEKKSIKQTKTLSICLLWPSRSCWRDLTQFLNMQDTTTTYLYICKNKRVVCTTKNFDRTVVK